jgi:hypothetical protein
MILLLYSLNFNKFKSVARYLARALSSSFRAFSSFVFLLVWRTTFVCSSNERSIIYLENFPTKRVLCSLHSKERAIFPFVKETRSWRRSFVSDYEPMKTRSFVLIVSAPFPFFSIVKEARFSPRRTFAVRSPRGTFSMTNQSVFFFFFDSSGFPHEGHPSSNQRFRQTETARAPFNLQYPNDCAAGSSVGNLIVSEMPILYGVVVCQAITV